MANVYLPSPISSGSPLRVAREHAVDVAGPQRRLLAAGAALDFDDHALLVVRVALDHRQPDLLFQLLGPAARARELVAQLGVLAELGEQLLRAARVVPGAPPSAGELGRGLELAVGTADLGVALAVGDDLGVGHLLAQLGEARLDLLDEVFDHTAESRRGRGHALSARRPQGLAPARRTRRRQAVSEGSAAASASSARISRSACAASPSTGTPSSPSDSSA
jgi:hypothetical protein